MYASAFDMLSSGTAIQPIGSRVVSKLFYRGWSWAVTHLYRTFGINSLLRQLHVLLWLLGLGSTCSDEKPIERIELHSKFSTFPGNTPSAKNFARQYRAEVIIVQPPVLWTVQLHRSPVHVSVSPPFRFARFSCWRVRSTQSNSLRDVHGASCALKTLSHQTQCIQ